MEPADLPHRLSGHVAALAGVIGERHVGRPDAYAAARDYIRRELIGAGGTPLEPGFEVDGVECANLEVVVAGADPALPCLVVGAHFDTVPGSPGADDNASGVAALIELVRELAPGPMRRTVRLVAFANEEAPHFGGPGQGSMVYVRELRAAGFAVQGMASLEMLGYYDRTPGSQKYPPLLARFYPDRGDFIGFVSNLRSRPWLQAFVGAFRAACDFPAEHLAAPEAVPGVSLSDQYAFWRAGIPAVMVTDTAFYRNPHYHTAADLPETVDSDALARVTEGLAGAIRRLAA